MSENLPRQPSALPVYVALFILLAFVIVFLIEFAQLTHGSGGTEDELLTEDTYIQIVMRLLENADPDNGEQLVLQYGCTTCHAGVNAGRLAPAFTLLPDIMGDRRPPLTAAAYVYESIIYPGAYTVEGYVNNMPRIYEEQIADDDLGDIIAYLTSAQPDSSD